MPTTKQFKWLDQVTRAMFEYACDKYADCAVVLEPEFRTISIEPDDEDSDRPPLWFSVEFQPDTVECDDPEDEDE